MTNTEEEKDYIGITINFGCEIDVFKDMFTSTYYSVGVNDGMLEAFNKHGVTYEDVVDVVKSTLGHDNLMKVSHDVTNFYVSEINSKLCVHFNLGDTKLVDGKASVPIVQMGHGLLRCYGEKFGWGISDEKYAPIIKQTISDEKFNELHESLKKNIFSKIPGAVI